jgi:competence ComEA-like helix-hairpin-helix protein
MATISLRAYTREIESMIDNGHYEEAAAHCRHILQTFPKHIDTYRLLGRAYLESERFNDADDVFQRLLSSIPDDFVSHLGMSVIRENQENLDAAIWHMERAYDMQPANTTVQNELKRLYSLRDEIEPAKIHLTRGALARMYLKGDLYPQAISELNSALSEEEDRFDLQTLLAQAYLLDGKKVEAVEICSTLINKLPYCLEANRILAEVLPEIERADEATTYRERVQFLEPYSAHTSTQLTNLDEVPDSAIKLEKLEYSPEEPTLPVEEQIEWIDTMGIDFEGLAPAENALPDWLNKPLEEEKEDTEIEVISPEDETEFHTPEVESQDITQSDEGIQEPPQESDSQEEDLIPDWMRSSGWEPASNSTIISPPSLDEITEELSQAEEPTDADMPDWLKDLAPDEPESTEEEDEEIPWLEETASDETETVETWLNDTKPAGITEELAESPPIDEEELPEWLEDLESQREVEEEEKETGLVDEGPTFDEEQAEILDQMPETEGLKEDSIETFTEPDLTYQEMDIEEGKEDLEVPAWLRAKESSDDKERELETETFLETTEEEEVIASVEEEMVEPLESEIDSEAIGIIGDQTTVETIDISDQEKEGMESEPSLEFPEVTPIADESDVEIEPSVIEMPASFEEHDEIEEKEAVETFEESDIDYRKEPSIIEMPAGFEEHEEIEEKEKEEEISDELTPGVTDWLRALEEVEEEITSEEPPPTDEPTLVEDVAQDQEITDDKPSGVTDWLRTLESLEEEQILEEEEPIEQELEIDALSQEQDVSKPSSIAIADKEEEQEDFLPEEEVWTEPMEESVDEEKFSEIQEIEHLVEEEPVSQYGPPLKDAIEEDEVGHDEVETPVKRIPGVTDWLRALKEIEEKEPTEEETLVTESDEEIEDTGIEGEEITKESERSSLKDEPVEVTGGEVPEWLKDLEFDLSDDYETDILSGDLPDWLESAAKGEEPVGEIDWSIFTEDEAAVEEFDEFKDKPAIEQIDEDIVEEPTPILGDTQPIRRKEKDEEHVEQPIEMAEEEVIESEGEADLVQVEEEDAAMAWLESLATREGLQEDEIIEEEQIVEEQPDWIQEATAEVESEIGTDAEAEEISEWFIEEVEPDIESVEIQDKTIYPVEEIEEGLDQVTAEEETAVLEQEEELVSEEIEEEPAALELEEELVSEEIEEEPATLELEEELVSEEIEEVPADLELEEELVSEEIEEEPAALELEEELVSEEIEEEPAALELEEELVSEEIEEEPAALELEEELVSEEIEEDRAALELEEELVSEEIEEEPVALELEEELVSEEIEEEPAVLELEEELISEEIEEEPDVLELDEELISEEIEEEPDVLELDEELVSEHLVEEPVVQEVKPELAVEASIDLNTATLSQLEHIPGVGFIIAQSIINYRDKRGVIKNLDELTEISDIDESKVEEIRPWLTIIIEAETPTEEILEEPLLLGARRAIETGELSDALEQYQQLIKEKQSLENVIQDLTKATQMYPTELPVFITLGDAYFHNDNLQDALDIYLQAEELLK